MSDIKKKYGYSIPFMSGVEMHGYIDDGYTIDENGICTGNLISSPDLKYVTLGVNQPIQVKLLAIENKLSYNLNTINNSDQILVMSKDNKYIFPFYSGYTPGLEPQDKETLTPYIYNPIYSFISIIFAIKTNNISIPLWTDFKDLMRIARSVNV